MALRHLFFCCQLTYCKNILFYLQILYKQNFIYINKVVLNEGIGMKKKHIRFGVAFICSRVF